MGKPSGYPVIDAPLSRLPWAASLTDWAGVAKKREQFDAAYGKPKKPCLTVLSNGSFDLLHPGHMLHLLDAFRQGTYHVVSLDTDEEFIAKRGFPPALKWVDRAVMVASLPYVHAVTWHGGEDSLPNLLRYLRPNIWAARSSQESLPEDELQACRDAGATLVQLPRWGKWASSLMRSSAPMLDNV